MSPDDPDPFAPTAPPVAAPTEEAAGRTVASPPPAEPTEHGTFADDFVLLRELGRGAFARVYLARQRSLGRLVAVKVSDRAGGGEGAVLAALEHEHIVSVFAEVREPATGRYGLVLQYVAGPHLGRVLADVFAAGRRPATGQHILDAVDRQADEAVAFDPSALADREVYRRGGYAAVVCRLMAKLADALALAHARNVLHCDIKPANVLLDRYGRPRLADFNVAVPLPDGGSSITPVGGTLAYMSPEHLAAFGGLAEQPPVDRRTDLYSLGLVLAEAASGLPPPAGDPQVAGLAMLISAWSQRRGEPDDWLGEHRQLVPEAVWRVARRCLAFHPADRFDSAGELAAALRGAADQLEREAALPPGPAVSRYTRRNPLPVLAALTFLPHLVGSAVNIAYNGTAIHLTPDEQATFLRTTAVYNLIVYPLCVAAAVAVALPLVRFLRGPHPERTPAADLDTLRGRALGLGPWAAWIAAVGWFPGGVVFPLALTDWAAGIDWPRFGHFVMSFTASGLIALTYSYLGIQYVIVRGVYPRLTHPEQTAEHRQADGDRLLNGLRWVPFAAAAVPLAGAVVQTAVAPTEFTLGFRLVITGLIVTGMIGLGVAVGVTYRLRRLVRLLTGHSG